MPQHVRLSTICRDYSVSAPGRAASTLQQEYFTCNRGLQTLYS